jgi:hypothetical protein
MTETLNRTVHGRLFRDQIEHESDSGSWGVVAQVFDRIRMPALNLEPGKAIYREFSLDVSESATLQLPADYTTGAQLYIAVVCDLTGRVTYTSPTHGTGRIVLVKGTDSEDDGAHWGFWVYQGDMTTFAVSVPAGGLTTTFRVLMYEIPDLEEADSYYDNEIGLGTT